MRKLALWTLAMSMGVLAATASDAQAQNYEFTSGSLAGARAAAAQALRERSCSGLTENRLMAIMLSIPVWELSGGRRDRSPSPMTLSRYDGWSRSKNHLLYSFGTYDDDKRAHWNPGVGLWQLDTWPSTIHLSHAERMDTHSGGVYVARYLRNAYCSGTSTLRSRLNGTWFACRTDKCWNTYNNMYASGDRLLVTGTAGSSHNGGAMDTSCRWGSRGTPFECFWVNPDNAEGRMNKGDPEGTGNRTPLAAPFLSLREGGNKRAAWLRSSGLGSEIVKAVPTSQGARAVNGWYRGTSLQVATCAGGCWTSYGVTW